MNASINAENRTKKGFSLTETLVALLILGLVSVMMVTGIRLAVTQHRKVVDKANAQVLMSTTIAELRTRLSNAYDVSINDNAIYYKDLGTKSNMVIKPTDKGMMIKYASQDDSKAKLLVTTEAASKNMHVECELSREGDLIVFTNIKVMRGEDKLAELNEYCIRCW